MIKKRLNYLSRLTLTVLFAISVVFLLFISTANIGVTESNDAVIAYAYEESLPSAVTLVGTVDLPPIDDQGAVGSCASQGVAYTQFTNAVSRYIHANYPGVTWNPSSGDKQYIFSPKATYTQAGPGTEWVYDILVDHGCPTLDKSSFFKDGNNASYCTDSNDVIIPSAVSWDVTEATGFDSLQFRLTNREEIWVINAPYVSTETPRVNDAANVMMTTSDVGRALISRIKDAINKGNVVATSGDVFRWKYSRVDYGGTYGKVGESVIYGASGADAGGLHVVGIVGYDDNITTTVNGVTLRGAFLLANSWGRGWQNKGYCWMMYDALNTVSEHYELSSNYPTQRVNALASFGITYWDQDIEAFQRPERILKLDITAQNREAVYVILTMCDNQTGMVSEHVPKVLYYGVDLNCHPNYYGLYDYNNDNSKWLTFDGYPNGDTETKTFYFGYQALLDKIPEGRALSDYTFGVKFAAARGGTVSYSNISLISDTGEVLQEKTGDSFTCVSPEISKRAYNGSVVFNNVKRLNVIEEVEEGCFLNYKSDTVQYGDKFEFTLSTVLGYSADDAVVLANGVAVSQIDGVYTIDNVTEDVTLSVSGITKVSQTKTCVNYYTEDGLYASYECVPGSSVTQPSNVPYKVGYNFEGWYADIYEQGVVGLDDYFPTTMPGCSFNAYAKFTPILSTQNISGGRYLTGMENYNGNTVLLYMVYCGTVELNNDFWNNRNNYEWTLHFTWQDEDESYTLEQVGNTPTSIYNWNNGTILYRFEICNHRKPLVPKKNLSYNATLTIKTPQTIYEVGGASNGYYLDTNPIYNAEEPSNITALHHFDNDNDFEFSSGKTYMTLEFEGIDESVYSGNYLWELCVTDQEDYRCDYVIYPNSFFKLSETRGLIKFPVFEFGWVPEYGGVYSVEFNVYEGNKLIYIASLSDVVCALNYKIDWEVNGETTTDYCPLGQIPSFDGTLSYETLEEKYEHIAWIKEVKPAAADCTYVSLGTLVTYDYTVTFMADGENICEYGIVSGETVTNIPTAPTKTGYSFVTWCSDVDLTLEYDFDTAITEDTVIYAKYEINTYTVSFNTQGGTAIDNQAVEYLGEAVRPDDPSKTGYTFIMWCADSDLTVEYDFDTAITEDTVIYAKYQINTYTVSFNTQGGTAIDNQYVVYLNKATQPNDPSKTGYTFITWCSDVDLTIEYDFDTAVTEDTVIYAKYQINTYTVSFNTQDGTAIDNQVVEYLGKAVRPDDPTKTGYTFIRWCSDVDLTTEYDFDTAITEDTIIYAKYQINTYSVSFNTQGGTVIDDQYVIYLNKATQPADPIKTGYTFIRWCSDVDLTLEYDFDTPITEDTVIYAKYQINTYTVSFNTQDGTAIDNQVVEYLGKVTRPANPSKTGYTFITWCSDSDLTLEYDFDTPITEDTVIYAKYEINTYTVSFNTQGGTAIDNQYVVYLNKATRPANPSKTGYTFIRWCSDVDLTLEYDFDTPITEDIVIYAKYQINTYTVLFNTQDGTAIDDQYVVYLNKATQPADPIKTGYTFITWCSDSDLTVEYDFDTPIIDDTVIYAKYQINTYTVSFNTQHGTTINDQIVEYLGKVTRPADPIKTGYTFIMWCKNSTLTVEYDFDTAVTEDIVIYAKYEINTYTVQFNTQGGTAIDDQSIVYLRKVVRPNDPIKTGYTFIAWYKDSDLTIEYNFNSAVTEDFILYAKYEIGTYTVSFNTQDGTEIDDQVVEYLGKATRPADPSKTGYTFITWCSDVDLTIEYDFDTAVTEDTVIYAKYEINTYTISFNTQDGTAIDNQVVEYLGKAVRPDDPTKTGYTFITWCSDSDLTVEYDFDTAIIEYTVIYAKYEINTYTVVFNTQGGTAIDNQYVVYLNKAMQPANPSKTGYTFITWCTDSDLTLEYDFDTAITEDTMIYANYQINTYTVSFNTQDGTTIDNQVVEYLGKATRPDNPVKTGYTFTTWCCDVDLTIEYNFDTAVTEDTVIYAKYEINTYTVSFNTQDGTAIDNQVVEYLGKAVRPDDPTKTGYTFITWCSDVDLTLEYDFDTAITEDTVIYANYEINTYTVSFDTQDGTAIDDQVVEYLGKATRPDDPTKVGYTLIAWCSDVDLIIEYDFDTAITEDTVIYAKYEINTYTVSFNTQDGTAIDDQTVEYLGKATRPANPSKTGYTFITWCSDSDLMTEYDFDTAITEDTVIYAKYEINMYTVSFNTQDGTAIDNQYVVYLNKATRPDNPSKIGYTFITWCSDSDLTVEYDFDTAITEDTVIYAKYQIVTYTVSFNTQGGTAIDDQIVEYAGKALRPNNPIKEGYVFVGWYVSDAFETEFDFTTPITSNRTIYAEFIIKVMQFDCFVWSGDSAQAKYVCVDDDSIVEFYDAVVTCKITKSENNDDLIIKTYTAEYGGHTNDKEETFDLTEHKLSDWIVDKQATKTEEGHRYKVCTDCGEVLAEEMIAKTASSVGEWLTQHPIVIVAAAVVLVGAGAGICITVKIKRGKKIH